MTRTRIQELENGMIEAVRKFGLESAYEFMYSYTRNDEEFEYCSNFIFKRFWS